MGYFKIKKCNLSCTFPHPFFPETSPEVPTEDFFGSQESGFCLAKNILCAPKLRCERD